MREPSDPEVRGADDTLGEFLRRTWDVASNDLPAIVEAARDLLGATSAEVLVADYALMSLQGLGLDGPVGESQRIEGTLAGRCLSRGETVTSGDDPTDVYIPLTDGSERMGVFHLTHADWDVARVAVAESLTRLLVLLLVSKRRYTDAVVRARRSEPLSTAAEIQWGLLPPLACSGRGFALSGILEPAYSIGGDSFDFALDRHGVRFALIDAVGHGMSAVLMSVAVVNALRNSRREGVSVEDAYELAGAILETQFGNDAYATGQLGAFDASVGELTWLNAGHPLPLLVRDGHVQELQCRPSWPMGLGGEVVEIAVERLQPRDCVLFYTDGAVDGRAPVGGAFGVQRLSEILVIATGEGVGPAETVRRLSMAIMAHNTNGLVDDATLLVLEHQGDH